MGVVQKSIFVGLLAVIVLIALIVFRQQNNTSESASSVKEKNEAYAKVIETLSQFGKKTDGLAAIVACVDSHLINEIDSNDGVSWKYILYDTSEDLSKEEMKSVYFAHVNASGEIKYIGQGRMMNSVLKSNISNNGIVLSPESSYAFVLPFPTEMYFSNTGFIRYFNEVECVEKDEIKRIEVYDYDPLTKTKSKIKTVSMKKDYLLIDMPADGESYEWTQEKGWVNKNTNQEAKVDSYSWEIFR
jgi:hypothetical protein